MGRNRNTLCTFCSKARWATREAAEQALHRIQMISDAEKVPVRVYPCPGPSAGAPWWHLTATPESEWKARMSAAMRAAS